MHLHSLQLQHMCISFAVRLLAHIIACEKKWMAAEVAKPKPRAFPDRPMELETGQLPTDAQDIDAFNARMFEKWQRLTMTACPNCGRTFKSVVRTCSRVSLSSVAILHFMFERLFV